MDSVKYLSFQRKDLEDATYYAEVNVSKDLEDEVDEDDADEKRSLDNIDLGASSNSGKRCGAIEIQPCNKSRNRKSNTQDNREEEITEIQIPLDTSTLMKKKPA